MEVILVLKLKILILFVPKLLADMETRLYVILEKMLGGS